MPELPGKSLCSSHRLENIGIIGCGSEDMGWVFDEMFFYDPITGNWTAIAALPNGDRRRLAAFTKASEAYFGYQRFYDNGFSNDIWKLDLGSLTLQMQIRSELYNSHLEEILSSKLIHSQLLKTYTYLLKLEPM